MCMYQKGLIYTERKVFLAGCVAHSFMSSEYSSVCKCTVLYSSSYAILIPQTPQARGLTLVGVLLSLAGGKGRTARSSKSTVFSWNFLWVPLSQYRLHCGRLLSSSHVNLSRMCLILWYEGIMGDQLQTFRRPLLNDTSRIIKRCLSQF